MRFSNKFVCEDREYSTYEKNIPAPMFRKRIRIESDIDSAELLICGLGFYDLYVNGKKITKGHLAPYISNPDDIVYFDKYDMKQYLSKGMNIIGVVLGDGFIVGKTSIWNINENVTNTAPMLALSAKIKTADKTITFEADEFVCRKGPILFNDLRSGVFYDARLEDDWQSVDYDDSDWHKPLMCTRPRGEYKECTVEPVKVTREIKPISITKGGRAEYVHSCQLNAFMDSITPFEEPAPLDGGYIYDFGENNAGSFRLKIKGERGQKISLQCVEQLTDGKANYNNINFYPDGFSQRDIYYLKGDGEEIFEPMFTYHGFRYIYVTGICEEQATEDLLTYLVMSSDLKEVGTFECSDETVNKIYQMCRRSDISNFYYFPNDCPHREKNGWTADISLSAEHMLMTIDAEKSLQEWLCNVRKAQKEDGQLPGIIPTAGWGYEWGNGPAWDNVIFNVPYCLYKYRGNTSVIKENASAMLRYLEYASRKRDERGIVAIGLGDWVPVGKAVADYDADLGFTDSVMVLDMCKKGAAMFEAVGLYMHKEFAEKLGCEMLDAIRREYVDKETLVVKNRCQTSQAMAVYYDVFTEEEKQRGVEVLLEIIREDNSSITSGVLGMRVLFHVLADFGYADLAYEMITKKEYPSYGHWAAKGETTLLEHFLPYDDFYQESKNHHLMGDVSNWFMSKLGGLRVQSSNFVIVKPCFVKSLNWCKTTYNLPKGSITIYWERKGENIELSIDCVGDVGYELAEKHRFFDAGKNQYTIGGMN